jgi:hypothetical protein
MQAKFIREALNFERTGTPLEKMGIGQKSSLYNILKKAYRNIEDQKQFKFNIFTEVSHFEVKIQGLIDNQMSGYNNMFNEMGIRGNIVLNENGSITINAIAAYFVGDMIGSRRDRKTVNKSEESELVETFDNADDFMEWLNELAS